MRLLVLEQVINLRSSELVGPVWHNVSEIYFMGEGYSMVNEFKLRILRTINKINRSNCLLLCSVFMNGFHKQGQSFFQNIVGLRHGCFSIWVTLKVYSICAHSVTVESVWWRVHIMLVIVKGFLPFFSFYFQCPSFLSNFFLFLDQIENLSSCNSMLSYCLHSFSAFI